MKKFLFFIFFINLIFGKTIVVDKNAICLPIFGCFFTCISGDYATNNIKTALLYSQNGDIIKICPGNYIESALNINKNITIEGVGDSPQDVNVSDNSEYPIFYTSKWRRDVVLKNFSIIQNGESSSTSALYIDKGKNFLLENLKISSKSYGIVVGNKIGDSNLSEVNVSAKNIAFSINKSYNGLYLNNSVFSSTNADAVNIGDITGDFIIKGCEFSAKEGDGIWIKKANYIDIENSYIHDTKYEGFYVGDTGKQVDMIGNIIENPGNYGVYIKDSSKAGSIKYNIIKGALVKGFYLLENKEYRGYEVINNCFENGIDKNVFNRDEKAYFNENYYNDWNGNGAYIIPDIPVYDNNPWSSCNIHKGPLLDYRMDECEWTHTTGDVKDSSENGYDGTSYGDANTSSDGKLCRAGEFLKDGSYIKIDKNLPDLSKYTIIFWVKFNDNQAGGPVFVNEDSNSILRYEVNHKNNQIYFKLVYKDSNNNISLTQGGGSYTDGSWVNIAITNDNGNIQIYINGKRKINDSLWVSFSIKNSSNDYIARDLIDKLQFIGEIDEFKIFNKVLSEDEIQNIYNNENNGKNYDGSERTCPVCTQPQSNYAFNAVSKIIYNNAVKDWDNNLTTQIVNKPFNLYILSKNIDTNTSQKAIITKVIFMYFTSGNNNQCSGTNEENQTICDDFSSNPCPDINNSSGESEIKNIKIPKAVKCIEVYIQGKQLNNTSALLQESNSTDDFASRPCEFNITNIPSKIKSGSEFNLTIEALDYNGNPVKDYNETLHLSNTSVEVEYNITKTGCYKGELNLTNGENFKNGETNATFVYNEVGDLNLTIKEVNGSEFAQVDSDDTSDNERFISKVSKTITIIPHHFRAIVNVNNYDSNFTYLDKNLTIYSLIDLNITAENEQNQTTKNYNVKCYAKDVDVNLTPNIFRHNEKLSKEVLYKVFYLDSNSTIYKNKDINFSVGEGNFSTEYNGSAIIKIHTNFERNSSIPESPFEFNISNAEVNNSDINLTCFKKNGKSLFYYGSLNMNDIITTQNDFNISHEFIVFDTNKSDTYLPSFKEIIINWYLNRFNHAKDANISKFVVTKGYVYNDNDIISPIDVKVNDINETLSLNIQRNDTNINFAVIHIIDLNASHLWYSKFNKEYNISKGSSCANHFCFTVTWKENIKESGIVSGNISGPKANVNSSNENKRGVKIFR